MKKILLLVIGILIIAVLILGGTFYWKNFRGVWSSIKKPSQKIEDLLPFSGDDSKVNDNEKSFENSGCIKTGCSGQICSDKDILTTCEFKPEYACYKNTECKRQSNGQCGFTPTKELQECLEKNKENNADN